MYHFDGNNPQVLNNTNYVNNASNNQSQHPNQTLPYSVYSHEPTTSKNVPQNTYRSNDVYMDQTPAGPAGGSSGTAALRQWRRRHTPMKPQSPTTLNPLPAPENTNHLHLEPQPPQAVPVSASNHRCYPEPIQHDLNKFYTNLTTPTAPQAQLDSLDDYQFYGSEEQKKIIVPGYSSATNKNYTQYHSDYRYNVMYPGFDPGNNYIPPKYNTEYYQPRLNNNYYRPKFYDDYPQNQLANPYENWTGYDKPRLPYYHHQYSDFFKESKIPSRYCNPYMPQNRPPSKAPAKYYMDYNPIPPIKPHAVTPSKPNWEPKYNTTMINDKYPFHGYVDPSTRGYPNQNFYNTQHYPMVQAPSNDWRSEIQILDQQIRPGSYEYNKYCRFNQMGPTIITEDGITISMPDFKTQNDEQQRKDELLKSKLNLKEFLENWDEETEEDNGSSANALDKDINVQLNSSRPENCLFNELPATIYPSEKLDPKTNLPDVIPPGKKVHKNDSDTMLYVLESTNIPEDAVWSDYKHIQQIDKLPDNIKLVTVTSEEQRKTENRPTKTFAESPDSTNNSKQIIKNKMEQQSRCDTVIKSPDTTFNNEFLDTRILNDGKQHREQMSDNDNNIVSSTCSVIKSPILSKHTSFEDTPDKFKKMGSTYQKLSTIIDFETKDINTYHKRCNNAGCNNQIFGRLCEECQTDEIINDLINPTKLQHNDILDLREENKRNAPAILNFDNLIDHNPFTDQFQYNELRSKRARPIIISNQLIKNSECLQFSTADLEAKLNDWEMELKNSGVKLDDTGISTLLDYENEITACKVPVDKAITFPNTKWTDPSEIIEALDLSGSQKLFDQKTSSKRHFSTEDKRDSENSIRKFESLESLRVKPVKSDTTVSQHSDLRKSPSPTTQDLPNESYSKNVQNKDDSEVTSVRNNTAIMSSKNEKNKLHKVKNNSYKVSLGNSSSKILITLKSDKKAHKSSKRDRNDRKSHKKKKRRKRSRDREHSDSELNRPPVKILIKLPKLAKPDESSEETLLDQNSNVFKDIDKCEQANEILTPIDEGDAAALSEADESIDHLSEDPISPTELKTEISSIASDPLALTDTDIKNLKPVLLDSDINLEPLKKAPILDNIADGTHVEEDVKSSIRTVLPADFQNENLLCKSNNEGVENENDKLVSCDIDLQSNIETNVTVDQNIISEEVKSEQLLQDPQTEESRDDLGVLSTKPVAEDENLNKIKQKSEQNLNSPCEVSENSKFEETVETNNLKEMDGKDILHELSNEDSTEVKTPQDLSFESNSEVIENEKLVPCETVLQDNVETNELILKPVQNQPNGTAVNLDIPSSKSKNFENAGDDHLNQKVELCEVSKKSLAIDNIEVLTKKRTNVEVSCDNNLMQALHENFSKECEKGIIFSEIEKNEDGIITNENNSINELDTVPDLDELNNKDNSGDDIIIPCHSNESIVNKTDTLIHLSSEKTMPEEAKMNPLRVTEGKLDQSCENRTENIIEVVSLNESPSLKEKSAFPMEMNPNLPREMIANTESLNDFANNNKKLNTDTENALLTSLMEIKSDNTVEVSMLDNFPEESTKGLEEDYPDESKDVFKNSQTITEPEKKENMSVKLEGNNFLIEKVVPNNDSDDLENADIGNEAGTSAEVPEINILQITTVEENVKGDRVDEVNRQRIENFEGVQLTKEVVVSLSRDEENLSTLSQTKLTEAEDCEQIMTVEENVVKDDRVKEVNRQEIENFGDVQLTKEVVVSLSRDEENLSTLSQTKLTEAEDCEQIMTVEENVVKDDRVNEVKRQEIENFGDVQLTKEVVISLSRDEENLSTLSQTKLTEAEDCEQIMTVEENVVKDDRVKEVNRQEIENFGDVQLTKEVVISLSRDEENLSTLSQTKLTEAEDYELDTTNNELTTQDTTSETNTGEIKIGSNSLDLSNYDQVTPMDDSEKNESEEIQVAINTSAIQNSNVDSVIEVSNDESNNISKEVKTPQENQKGLTTTLADEFENKMMDPILNINNRDQLKPIQVEIKASVLENTNVIYVNETSEAEKKDEKELTSNIADKFENQSMNQIININNQDQLKTTELQPADQTSNQVESSHVTSEASPLEQFESPKVEDQNETSKIQVHSPDTNNQDIDLKNDINDLKTGLLDQAVNTLEKNESEINLLSQDEVKRQNVLNKVKLPEMENNLPKSNEDSNELEDENKVNTLQVGSLEQEESQKIEEPNQSENSLAPTLSNVNMEYQLEIESSTPMESSNLEEIESLKLEDQVQQTEMKNFKEENKIEDHMETSQQDELCEPSSNNNSLEINFPDAEKSPKIEDHTTKFDQIDPIFELKDESNRLVKNSMQEANSSEFGEETDQIKTETNNERNIVESTNLDADLTNAVIKVDNFINNEEKVIPEIMDSDLDNSTEQLDNVFAEVEKESVSQAEKYSTEEQEYTPIFHNSSNEVVAKDMPANLIEEYIEVETSQELSLELNSKVCENENNNLDSCDAIVECEVYEKSKFEELAETNNLNETVDKNILDELSYEDSTEVKTTQEISLESNSEVSDKMVSCDTFLQNNIETNLFVDKNIIIEEEIEVPEQPPQNQQTPENAVNPDTVATNFKIQENFKIEEEENSNQINQKSEQSLISSCEVSEISKFEDKLVESSLKEVVKDILFEEVKASQKSCLEANSEVYENVKLDSGDTVLLDNVEANLIVDQNIEEISGIDQQHESKTAINVDIILTKSDSQNIEEINGIGQQQNIESMTDINVDILSTKSDNFQDAEEQNLNHKTQKLEPNLLFPSEVSTSSKVREKPETNSLKEQVGKDIPVKLSNVEHTEVKATQNLSSKLIGENEKIEKQSNMRKKSLISDSKQNCRKSKKKDPKIVSSACNTKKFQPFYTTNNKEISGENDNITICSLKTYTEQISIVSKDSTVCNSIIDVKTTTQSLKESNLNRQLNKSFQETKFTDDEDADCLSLECPDLDFDIEENDEKISKNIDNTMESKTNFSNILIHSPPIVKRQCSDLRNDSIKTITERAQVIAKIPEVEMKTHKKSSKSQKKIKLVESIVKPKATKEISLKSSKSTVSDKKTTDVKVKSKSNNAQCNLVSHELFDIEPKDCLSQGNKRKFGQETVANMKKIAIELKIQSDKLKFKKELISKQTESEFSLEPTIQLNPKFDQVSLTDNLLNLNIKPKRMNSIETITKSTPCRKMSLESSLTDDLLKLDVKRKCDPTDNLLDLNPTKKYKTTQTNNCVIRENKSLKDNATDNLLVLNTKRKVSVQEEMPELKPYYEDVPNVFELFNIDELEINLNLTQKTTVNEDQKKFKSEDEPMVISDTTCKTTDNYHNIEESLNTSKIRQVEHVNISDIDESDEERKIADEYLENAIGNSVEVSKPKFPLLEELNKERSSYESEAENVPKELHKDIEPKKKENVGTEAINLNKSSKLIKPTKTVQTPRSKIIGKTVRTEDANPCLSKEIKIMDVQEKFDYKKIPKIFKATEVLSPEIFEKTTNMLVSYSLNKERVNKYSKHKIQKLHTPKVHTVTVYKATKVFIDETKPVCTVQDVPVVCVNEEISETVTIEEEIPNKDGTRCPAMENNSEDDLLQNVSVKSPEYTTENEEFFQEAFEDTAEIMMIEEVVTNDHIQNYDENSIPDEVPLEKSEDISPQHHETVNNDVNNFTSEICHEEVVVDQKDNNEEDIIVVVESDSEIINDEVCLEENSTFIIIDENFDASNEEVVLVDDSAEIVISDDENIVILSDDLEKEEVTEFHFEDDFYFEDEVVEETVTTSEECVIVKEEKREIPVSITLDNTSIEHIATKFPPKEDSFDKNSNKVRINKKVSDELRMLTTASRETKSKKSRKRLQRVDGKFKPNETNRKRFRGLSDDSSDSSGTVQRIKSSQLQIDSTKLEVINARRLSTGSSHKGKPVKENDSKKPNMHDPRSNSKELIFKTETTITKSFSKEDSKNQCQANVTTVNSVSNKASIRPETNSNIKNVKLLPKTKISFSDILSDIDNYVIQKTKLKTPKKSTKPQKLLAQSSALNNAWKWQPYVKLIKDNRVEQEISKSFKLKTEKRLPSLKTPAVVHIQ